MSDGGSELLGSVAKLRLKSAVEELQTRSADPAVRRRLLEELLVKVRSSTTVVTFHEYSGTAIDRLDRRSELCSAVEANLHRHFVGISRLSIATISVPVAHRINQQEQVE